MLNTNFNKSLPRGKRVGGWALKAGQPYQPWFLWLWGHHGISFLWNKLLLKKSELLKIKLSARLEKLFFHWHEWAWKGNKLGKYLFKRIFWSLHDNFTQWAFIGHLYLQFTSDAHTSKFWSCNGAVILKTISSFPQLGLICSVKHLLFVSGGQGIK